MIFLTQRKTKRLKGAKKKESFGGIRILNSNTTSIVRKFIWVIGDVLLVYPLESGILIEELSSGKAVAKALKGRSTGLQGRKVTAQVSVVTFGWGKQILSPGRGKREIAPGVALAEPGG